jgi:hypothetical protein
MSDDFFGMEEFARETAGEDDCDICDGEGRVVAYPQTDPNFDTDARVPLSQIVYEPCPNCGDAEGET